MPRTSRALLVIDERAEALRHALRQAEATHKSIQASLEELLSMRDKIERAVPKRTSKSKNRVAPAANAQPPATATVA